ncbi:coiled-coil domain-containing protein 34-like [Mya arenaria]|uniref:coiled-coil domain-containing protein 34-like n=1 Tax=Mya arenaria TaxID=6604 RepID=UPI0022E8B73A|nr:coiled-coil domain-containing protein 34-like [Mya arenaria]
MNRRSRSHERATNLRPRPVTATVTKPSWMRPEAIVGPRSRSLESRGSTASLTSVLDHDSYISLSEDDEDFPNEIRELPRRGHQSGKENRQPAMKNQKEIHNNTFTTQKKVGKKKIIRKYVESSYTDDTTETESPEPGLSPWEQWLIQKVKEDRQKLREERQKVREEKQKKREEAMVKQKKLEHAEKVRQEWVDKKNFEEKLKTRVEKQRTKTEKMILEEQKKLERVKAERKFNDWKEEKRLEERRKKKEEKLKEQEEEKLRKDQRIAAQQKFEEWCKRADAKSKPLPNSFGYTDGKLTGYHDTCAYPVPSFYNPMPWQPIHIPRPASEKRTKRRGKPKPKYAWNPEKYR